MIHPQTYLRIADNTGARKIICVRVLGSRSAKLGDLIIAVVKESLPHLTVTRSEIVRALVVRTRKQLCRSDGSLIRFDENAAVILNKENNPRGSRVFGPIPREIRNKNFIKVISLARVIVLLLKMIICQTVILGNYDLKQYHIICYGYILYM